ncbi:MAG: restriction endonuclease, SacI family [SAR202 cluster bacterium]|jgi:hypothetical protein|nr:restriction endonuclease, SacI family [SAR202 cluster bacterium]MDP6514842.1 restriction endonuclease, SacI family [SAR202 cluster bacterium]MDP6713219.1 restriction endonuclease, SacI family [SAR202 cluster bacterium]
MPVDYESASMLLETIFDQAQTNFDDGSPPLLPGSTSDNVDRVFRSRTQAFREVLVGCVLARVQDKDINIRHPYVNQGTDSFNGRTLDERVVNPLLQSRQIPCSRGPYLSVFRRSVALDESTRDGVRDKTAYDNFMNVLDWVEQQSDNDVLSKLLSFLMHKFIELREATQIPLIRIQRMSLEQLGILSTSLLDTPSGGRFPQFLVVATIQVIKERFGLDWDISWQGINVADTASGAGGDITVSSGDQVIFACEVTEGPWMAHG